MTPKSLQSRAKYISLCFRKFPQLTKDAKVYWEANGGKIKRYPCERLTEEVMLLDFEDIRTAVYNYVINNEDKIVEMYKVFNERRKIKRQYAKMAEAAIASIKIKPY